MLLESQSSVGQFDFQLRLDVTGTIYMLYKTVPLPIEDVSIISRRFVSTFYLFIFWFSLLNSSIGLKIWSKECRSCANYLYY